MISDYIDFDLEAPRTVLKLPYTEKEREVLLVDSIKIKPGCFFHVPTARLEAAAHLFSLGYLERFSNSSCFKITQLGVSKRYDLLFLIGRS